MVIQNTDNGVAHNDNQVGSGNDDPETWTTWNEATLQCCTKQKTITITLQQVLDRYPEGSMLLWSLPARKDVLVFASDSMTSTPITTATSRTNSSAQASGSGSDDVEKIVESIKVQLQEMNAAVNADITSSSLSTPSKVWSTVSSLVVAGKNLIIGEDEDSDLDDPEWTQAGDAPTDYDDENDYVVTTETLDRKLPVVQEEVLRRCFVLLGKYIKDQHIDFPMLLARHEQLDSAQDSALLPVWRTWCRALQPTPKTATDDDPIAKNVLSNLSINDSELLLQILVAMGMARIITKDEMRPDVRGGEIVALLGAEEESFDSNVIETRMAILKLDLQCHATEMQINKWTRQIEECYTRASAYKKKTSSTSPNDPYLKRALSELRKRKKLQEEVYTYSRRLSNLEQAKFTLKSANETTSVVQALADSRDALRHMRQKGPTAEEVDEVFEDLHENSLEQAQMIFSNDNIVFDEDELLAELASLTINDNEEVDNHDSSVANPNDKIETATAEEATNADATTTEISVANSETTEETTKEEEEAGTGSGTSAATTKKSWSVLPNFMFGSSKKDEPSKVLA